MGVITTQLDTLWSVSSQTQRVVEAKAALQNAYHVIVETNAKVQALADGGDLNAVPIETKAALNAAWTALKTAQTALEAANVQEALNWAGR